LDSGDKYLIEALKSQDPGKRDRAIYHFYSDHDLKAFVTGYIKNHNGSEEDADDAFQEAIILLDRNVRNGSFRGDSSLKTYFFAIVKWYWLAVQRKKRITVGPLQPDDIDIGVESVEDDLIYLEKKEFLDRAVASVGLRCRELLGYYKLDYSMKEIASLMGFSSPAMAKKQAYRCREKLREFLSGHSEYLQLFSNH